MKDHNRRKQYYVRDNHATYAVSKEKPNIVWGVAVRCKDDKEDEPVFICYETKDYEKALDFQEAVETGHTGYKNVVETILVEKSIQIFRYNEPRKEEKK